MKTAVLAIRETFACRLCWRITAAVFALILVIESLLLIPSGMRFQQLELDKMAERAEAWIEPLLLIGKNNTDSSAVQQGLSALIGTYAIESVALYLPDGALALAVGEAPPPLRPDKLDMADSMARRLTRSEDGSKLDVMWRSRSAETPTVVVRMDSSRLRGDLLAYLLRIGGLVILIVLFVTVGTMLILDRWVLRTIIRLRNSSRSATAEPGKADQFLLLSRRQDELGELISTHNSMLTRVAESKRRDKEVADERARYLTRHQALTGLPNREALIEYIDFLHTADAPTAESGAAQASISLLLLNLVRFRDLNTSFGVTRCDALLQQIAARLRRIALSQSFVAHIGADRFAVVEYGPRQSAEDMAELAEMLLRELAVGYEIESTGIARISMRIGISQSADRAIDGTTLLGEAELALARISESKDARYLFFSLDLAAQVRERQLLGQDLEGAVERGELFPVLQPKLALTKDGGVRLSGAEALVRWRHPQRGMVRPDQFIAVAESTGVIDKIGELMLHAACSSIRRWIDRHGWSPSIAVNLSAHQFSDEALPRRIERAVQEFSVPFGLLEVEITESMAMKNAVQTVATLQALRAIGVRISIDDFGTGYSSLSYLRRFAVDAIKIDKSFVDDIGLDRNADAICDAILRLGQALGSKVIAEGVETDVQLAFLRKRRCDEVQGYLLGKPMTVDDFETTCICPADRARGNTIDAGETIQPVAACLRPTT